MVTHPNTNRARRRDYVDQAQHATTKPGHCHMYYYHDEDYPAGPGSNTSPWMKQLTWLRIVHSGDRCLRLALRTPSGAYQQRRRRNVCWHRMINFTMISQQLVADAGTIWFLRDTMCVEGSCKCLWALLSFWLDVLCVILLENKCINTYIHYSPQSLGGIKQRRTTFKRTKCVFLVSVPKLWLSDSFSALHLFGYKVFIDTQD